MFYLLKNNLGNSSIQWVGQTEKERIWVSVVGALCFYCRVLKEVKLGHKREAEVCRRTAIDLLSCNRDPIWPNLEHTSGHAPAHTCRVTGHKEPLCQVTEHREKDKGLEGCDMTNMRSFAGLWGDWRYSQGWLTLLICITHQSRSQQRRADQTHTWSMDTKPTVCAHKITHYKSAFCKLTDWSLCVYFLASLGSLAEDTRTSAVLW